MKERPELTIVVVSFNTKSILRKCLNSLEKVQDETSFEVIVVDNASIDGSSEMVAKDFEWIKLIKNQRNLGFAKGNNSARPKVEGRYVLFLNSDTVVYPKTLRSSLAFLKQNPEIGAMTCRVELPDGSLDKDTRRAFIDPWIGLTHLILRLDRLFPRSRVFSRYWYGYMPDSIIQQVDVIQGAFFLTTKKILDKVGWFDEDYFLDGEDIDLCWKIKQEGYFIYYYPKVKITHFKGASKGKLESSRRHKVPKKERMKNRMAGVESMEIFYKKRLWSKNKMPVNYLVLLGVRFLKLQRRFTTLLIG